jgi:hypothetical protein
MCKFTLIPLIVFAMSAMLAWAMTRHLEMAQEQRATAAARPRSRPYDTSMPEL